MNNNFITTTLMIKEHSDTGLKYFCKSIQKGKALLRYKGSGSKWLEHLKINGNNIDTTVLGVFDIREDCINAAVKFSIENDIVGSDKWANCMIESGIGGTTKGSTWSDDIISLEALKYNSRTEFSEGNNTAYDMALRLNIMNKVCSHMKNNKNKWTDEVVSDIIQKYKNRKEFSINHPEKYECIIKNNKKYLLDIHFGKLIEWNYILAQKEALKYNSRIRFQSNSNGAYSYASKHKMLDSICAHMSIGIHNIDNIFNEAIKYNSKLEFKNSAPDFFAAATYRKIMNDITKHMLFRKNPNKKTIAVFGSSGFIGNNFISKIKEDFNIFKIDMVGDVNIRVDLSNPTEQEKASIDAILRQTDIVIHLASSVGVKLVEDNPSRTFMNSHSINNILLPMFEKHSCSVLFASTSEVYGSRETPCVETDSISITSPCVSMRGGYASQKVSAEFAIKSYTFPYEIVRFFNIVGGRGQQSSTGMVMPSFIEKALKNEPLNIYGDGSGVRSYCDIRDCVNVLNIMISRDFNNEITNIGALNVYSTLDLANEVIRILKSSSSIKFLPARDAEINTRIPNIDKMRTIYTPIYSLQDIIESMYGEYDEY